MNSLDGRRADEDLIPRVQEFEGVGELTVGGTVAAGDVNRLLFTCLVLLNDPAVNSYMLANGLKLQDRLTKTKVFPRDGMSLPNGEVFSAPQEETLDLPETTENN